MLPNVTNQKYLSNWYRTVSPNCKALLLLREAYPSLDKRLAHMSLVQYTGGHKPFDLPNNLKIVIGHQPNAFLKTLLYTQEESMSQYQMGLYLKLLLGLPIPALFAVLFCLSLWFTTFFPLLSSTQLQAECWQG